MGIEVLFNGWIVLDFFGQTNRFTGRVKLDRPLWQFKCYQHYDFLVLFCYFATKLVATNAYLTGVTAISHDIFIGLPDDFF